MEGFEDAAKALTEGRGADVVVDPVGGDRFTDSLRRLAPEVRLLVVGFTGGEIPTGKVNRLLLNNTAVVGVGWGAFALARTDFIPARWAELVPHLESGALAPVLGQTYPWIGWLRRWPRWSSGRPPGNSSSVSSDATCAR
ncbi:MAG: zinc-binding dehydrogenase [Micromonosporaceae bacterium]